MAFFLGLDVGTTGSKSTIFDAAGRKLSSAYCEYRLYHRAPYLSELNPAEVWSAIRKVIRESIKKSGAFGVRPSDIRAVCTSVLGEAFLPVDKNGAPLCWSMTTVDARAVEQTKWWEKNFAPGEIYKITGQPLSNSMPIYTLQKIQWIREHKKSIYAKTWKFLCWEDYVNYKLTGTPVIDYSLASRTMMFDIRKSEWSAEILETAGIDAAMLPEVRPSGFVVGEVKNSAQRETGLLHGTPVVAGGHDQACGALGAGITHEGSLMDATGTVECYGAVNNRLGSTPTDTMRRKGYAVHSYVIEGKYFTFGFNPTGGAVLRWFRDNLASAEKTEAEKSGADVYDVIISKASASPVGAKNLFLLPYFEGSGTPNWNRAVKGAIIGLTLSHTKNDIARAILEGLCCELRWNIDVMENNGFSIGDIRAIGGGAKSRFWLQMKADVTGKKVLVPETKMETTALGAAILASKGIGFYGDVNEAVKRMSRVKERYHAKPEVSRRYKEVYGRYIRLHPLIKNFF